MLLRRNRAKLQGICPNELINFNKNDLLDALHERFFESYRKTLDIADYVPQSYIDKVYKQIYKAQKAMYKQVNKRDKAFQKWYIERLPEILAARKEQDRQDKDGDTDE